MKELTTEFASPADFTERFINQTNQSVFLTGKAGTGKTTLLKKIIATTHKNTVVVAPTGIAALNAGGVTIHSFFQLPLGGFIPEHGQPPLIGQSEQFNTKDTLFRYSRQNKRKKDILLKLELLIIDEVSMLRSDLLDAIDYKLKRTRRNDEPFGGVQVLFIGDLLQLPPIVKDQEWNILRQYYKGQFFFHSKVIEQNPPLYIELEKIHRQSDTKFIQLLNELRNNYISEQHTNLLNQYVQPNFDSTKHEGYITLTTHNYTADDMNRKSLDAINSNPVRYHAVINKNFPENIYPIPKEMELKIGAQVMFIKNDLSYEKRYFNGKIGVVSDLTSNEVFVSFPEEKVTINVERYDWENKKFTLDEESGEIKEEVIGIFSHFPLKLAWAITVHKSQGLTFDKAVLDLSRVFAPGQAYVALSRLTSLDGLILKSPIHLNGLRNEADVVNYSKNKADENTLAKALDEETANYLRDRLQKTFNWESLASKWAMIESEHQAAGERSEMGKHKPIFEKQTNELFDTLEPTKKFRSQLLKICSQRPVNLEYLNERYEAAYQYFIKQLEPIFRGNIKQLVLLGTKKNVKQYFEKLTELDDLMTEVIGDLKRSKNLVQCLTENKELTKESVWDSQVKNFKEAKVRLVEEEIKRENPSLEDDINFYSLRKDTEAKKTKKKSKKRVKGATYLETLSYYHQGKTASEIAKIRELNEGTILSHFAYLIKDGKVKIEDVLEEDKINSMISLFGKEFPETLSEAKAIVGEDISFSELRIYQASLEID